MHWLRRTHSLFSRLLLAAALLAWAGFAFGAPALQHVAPVQPVQGMAAGHCDGTLQPDAAAQHEPAPPAPVQHGGCCHAGCHCLSAFSAVLHVPFAGGGTGPEIPPPPSAPAPGVPVASAAPPLRPPIA